MLNIISQIRNMLRLTAKSTQFGHRTFTSWLIESAGTVPIKRRKDFTDESAADNTQVMEKLLEVIILMVKWFGSISLFEPNRHLSWGMRYAYFLKVQGRISDVDTYTTAEVRLQSISSDHCSIEDWRCVSQNKYIPKGVDKDPVSRIVSDVLNRNRNNPDFEISVLTCSITYMLVNFSIDVIMLNLWSCRHRQHFRSDVLVIFNPPMVFSVKNNPELLAPVDYGQIRALTARMHQEISSRTIDAPSWDLVRVARLAARIYAPLGTRMSLGDYVRVTRIFVEAFKVCHPPTESETYIEVEVTKEDEALMALHRDLKVGRTLALRW